MHKQINEDNINKVSEKTFSSIAPVDDDYEFDLNDNSDYINDASETDIDETLLKQAEEHYLSGFNTSKSIDPEYISGVMLLSLLKKAKCPIYLFDHIVDWARKSQTTYNTNFNSTKLSRKKCIDQIYKKYDLKGIYPNTTTIKCSGSNQEVTVVWHDFKQCLYSLLMDEELMQNSNLLSSEVTEQDINDVNSGSVWKNASSFYIRDKERERLVPIIFFTDKPILISMVVFA